MSQNSTPQTSEKDTRGATSEHACCVHHKNTPRSQEMQADLIKRLNRVTGQLGGIKAMVEDNRYCGDILTQLSAAESAIHSISAIVLQNHFETCVVEEIQSGNTEIIDEALALVKKFAR